MLLAAAALLSGCGRGEDPYRIDTVVRIPAEAGETEAQLWETIPEPTQFPPLVFPGLDPVPEFTVPSDAEEETKQENKKPSDTSKTEPKETRPRATETSTPRMEPTNAPGTAEVPGMLEREILDAVNELRRVENLNVLTEDALLSDMACTRSRELAVSWSHTRPDGREYTSLAEDFGWGGVLEAELLAYISGGEDGTAVVEKWAGAQKQRSLLLNSGTGCAGIGVWRENGVTYICLLLGQL